jgi:hypothetical protein
VHNPFKLRSNSFAIAGSAEELGVDTVGAEPQQPQQQQQQQQQLDGAFSRG